MSEICEWLEMQEIHINKIQQDATKAGIYYCKTALLEDFFCPFGISEFYIQISVHRYSIIRSNKMQQKQVFITAKLLYCMFCCTIWLCLFYTVCF